MNKTVEKAEECNVDTCEYCKDCVCTFKGCECDKPCNYILEKYNFM